MPDTLHIAETGDSAEVSFARAISLLGVSPETPATFFFDERGYLPTAWQLWQDQWLGPHLAQNFVDAFHCGSDFRIHELQAIDTLLDIQLTESVRERSKEAAIPFLEGKEEMRANREWTRFADRIASGETPGHVCVVFALQSALYRLPLASALSAYIWFEFRSGLPRDLSRESLSELSSVFEEALVYVSAVVQNSQGAHPQTLRSV